MEYTNIFTGIHSVIFLFPALFILAAFFLMVKPPKSINSIYGYRTGISMKNQKNWDYANKLAPVAMLITGIVVFLLGLLLAQVGLAEHIFALLLIGSMIACSLIMITVIEWETGNFDKKQS